MCKRRFLNKTERKRWQMYTILRFCFDAANLNSKISQEKSSIFYYENIMNINFENF